MQKKVMQHFHGLNPIKSVLQVELLDYPHEIRWKSKTTNQDSF